MSNIMIGQNTSTAQPFISYIVNEYPSVRDFTISNNGKEAYFTAQSQLEEISQIVVVRFVNGYWTNGELCSFSSMYKDLEPFLSPDNLRLYFASNRPLVDSVLEPKDYDLWYVKRNDLDSAWSEPINIGLPINTKNNEFYPSLSNNMNLYYTSDASGFEGKDNILMSRWEKNKYTRPISLGDSINTDGYEYNAFISRDESYIMYGAYKRKDGYGSGDIYMSTKDKKGNWRMASNMGKLINSKYMDYCPYVDERSNILYFTSKRSMLKGQSFKNIDAFLKTINGVESGRSRLYEIKITD